MNRRIAWFVVALAILAFIAGPAFADAINVWDETADLFSGKKDNVEYRLYGAYTVKEPVEIKGIPILPAGLRTKVSKDIGADMSSWIAEIGMEF